MTVLIVDDSSAFLDLLRETLEPKGFEVLGAGDGLEALQILDHSKVDAVISDILMPKLDGYGLCKEIRKNPRWHRIPFIFHSGTFDSDVDRALAFEVGADDFLTKPATFAQILGAMEGARNRKRPLMAAREVNEIEVMREYNERLIEKLEDRNLQLIRRTSQLQASEQLFRQLAENIREVFWMLDTVQEKLLYVSPAYQEITGATCQSLYENPKSWLGAIQAEDQARVSAAIKGPEGWRAFDVEYRVMRPDDTVRWVRNRAFPVQDAKEKTIRLVGVADDITSQKESQARLQQQAKLLDMATDAILVRDLEHRISYWNSGSERLYGWTREEASGKLIQDLIYKNSAAFLEAHAQLLREGEWGGESQQIAKNGKSLLVSSRWTLLRDSRGQPESILVIDSDITEKKKLEDQLLRAQRLESIGTLASGIAHDLNNILAPIVLSCTLLRLNLSREETDRTIQTIETTAQRGVDVIKQLLTFAQGLEGRRIPIQLRHQIKEIAKIARETFPRSITLRPVISSDLWNITGDPTQIHQILLNLCVNARDAMPDGGTLTINAANLLVDESYASMTSHATPGPYVLLEVSDTGCGIAQDIMERIFDPFFTTKEQGKGTGLGLSTVMGIVKSHSGFIHVYSEMGHGTTFKIYLPATLQEAAEPEPVERDSAPNGQGELVLVVDDERAVRDVTRKILSRHGYEVVTAEDGADALTQFMEHRAKLRLVLTDLMMPCMDGVSLIRVLRRMDPQVRVIASSGLADRPRLDELQELGVTTFLNKPYDTHTMLMAMHQLLSE